MRFSGDLCNLRPWLGGLLRSTFSGAGVADYAAIPGTVRCGEAGDDKRHSRALRQEQKPRKLGWFREASSRNSAMTDYDRTVSTPRTPERSTPTTTGPIFTRLDVIAGIAAAVMTLMPLAMAAFAVGRH
jgi:hypothetical protein